MADAEIVTTTDLVPSTGSLRARAAVQGATSEAFTDPELKALQVLARGEGRCGSLQTHTGLPCRRTPAPGFTVCWKHGSRAPQTVAKAERVLAVARMPAVEWVLDELDRVSQDTCSECGFPRHTLKERKRIDTLAFKLLDRTGLGPRQTIDVNSRKTEEGADLMLDQMNAEEKTELADLIRRHNDLRARVLTRLSQVVVLGEG